jgi:hypothetical protein
VNSYDDMIANVMNEVKCNLDLSMREYAISRKVEEHEVYVNTHILIVLHVELLH